MAIERLDHNFSALTGYPPFPWQRGLFRRFVGHGSNGLFPPLCDIPTGPGRGSVMAVWVLALADHAARGRARAFPRRLVYVVKGVLDRWPAMKACGDGCLLPGVRSPSRYVPRRTTVGRGDCEEALGVGAARAQLIVPAATERTERRERFTC